MRECQISWTKVGVISSCISVIIWLMCALVMTSSPVYGAMIAGKDLLAFTSFDIDSKVLSENRHINVYLPPTYRTETDLRYPVLYMLDGGVTEDFPHVAHDVDVAIRAHEMQPMIVIGIENTERRRDMTGPTDVPSDRKIAPHVGGAAVFRSFIADELMTEVEHRYRTTGKTAIVGESLAGLFVVETLLLRPRLFDTYIALSPSLWWNDEALARDAAVLLKKWPGSKKTLYIASASDDDITEAVERLCLALLSTSPQNLTWYYRFYPDLHHSDIYRRASPAVFRKMFPPATK